MSNLYLLPEILDYITDLLHDEPETLKRCCLASKPWIPRTRKHLFANIELQSEEHLELWKELFPDPSTSPARYAKSLFIGCPRAVVVADAEPGGWIRGFSRVVHLAVHSQATTADRSSSLVPFHGLSPVLKSLRVTVLAPLSSQIIDLVFSFPLLEDLAVATCYGTSTDYGDSPNKLLTTVQPSSPPAFTGSFELYVTGGMESVTRRLLSLPGGIHFRRLNLSWFHEADPSATVALVERCSHTLESLKIYDFARDFVTCTSVQNMCPC
jgi:hypothetical protein